MIATAAQLEPILLTYDGGGPASDVVDEAVSTEPDIQAHTSDGSVHRVWRGGGAPPRLSRWYRRGDAIPHPAFEPIRLHLPIHFKGEAGSPGVKTQGGCVSHLMTDAGVFCLPKDLPEFLELDL